MAGIYWKEKNLRTDFLYQCIKQHSDQEISTQEPKNEALYTLFELDKIHFLRRECYIRL
jgi:hypothetical protein